MDNNERPQHTNPKDSNNNALIPINTKAIETPKIQNSIKKMNISNILNNPMVQPLVKQTLELLLKNLIKQKLIQLVSTKGSKYIANNVIKFFDKKKGQNSNRKRY